MPQRSLPEGLQPLLERRSVPLCILPGSPCWDPTISDQIDSYSGSSHSLKAALHLLNDDISRAHTIAQDHEDVMTCNLIHCILHRREQDFWNSNWWCRRLDHPLLQIIHGGDSNAEAQERACRFTDECEAATKGASTACGAKKVQDLKKMQTDELITLVKWILENEP